MVQEYFHVSHKEPLHLPKAQLFNSLIVVQGGWSWLVATVITNYVCIVAVFVCGNICNNGVQLIICEHLTSATHRQYAARVWPGTVASAEGVLTSWSPVSNNDKLWCADNKINSITWRGWVKIHPFGTNEGQNYLFSEKLSTIPILLL